MSSTGGSVEKTHSTTHTSSSDALSTSNRLLSGITLRSVVLGFCCVVFVAVAGPYNDFGLNNTLFIGNHFPIGITLMMCLVILGLNPLLKLIRPQAVFRSTELITIWAMCLIAAAFPTAGLLRQLIPWLVMPVYMLPQNPEWEPVLALLPDWLFPLKDPTADQATQVLDKFYLGSDQDNPFFVPWAVWWKPLLIWGVYYVPFYLGVLMLSILLSRQWIVQEKLQYPIATVMLEMVRDAPKGRRFNSLFSDRRMWLGAGIVIAIHLINGLHSIYPKIPAIPLGYSLGGIFTEGFWPHIVSYMKSSKIYFSMLGIAFLMASEVSLSLWFFVVVYGIIIAFIRYNGSDPLEAIRSQHYGAILAMGGYLLFLARSHLSLALRMAFLRPRNPREHAYATYRWVVWALILCMGVCTAWLCATGMPIWLAIAQLVILYLIFLVLSRLVAETGLFFVVPQLYAQHLFQLIAPNLLAVKNQVLVISSAWSSLVGRETLMPFAFNALRLRHEAEKQQPGEAGGDSLRNIEIGSGRFIGALIGAMIISLVVGGAVSIVLYYSWGAVRTGNWAAFGGAASLCNHAVDYIKSAPVLPGQGPEHMLVGAALIVLLGACRLRFARWPFVPIALCMATSGALGAMWFSILIGWACKASVMRIGGVAVYNRLRPVFLGLVIGEVFMAGIWMAVGAGVILSGYEALRFVILPG